MLSFREVVYLTTELIEIEQQISQCENEMSLRLQEGMRFYVPHSKQLEYHKLQNEIRALIGANQSGKTFAGNWDDLVTLGGVHPYRKNHQAGHRGRIVASDEKVLFGTIIAQVRRMVIQRPCELTWKTFEGKQGYWPGLLGGNWDEAFSAQAMTLTLANYSMLDFKTNKQDVLSHAGVPLDWIRFDEEPEEAIYRENTARGLTRGVDERHTLTMLQHSNWIYNELYMRSAEDKRIGIVVMTIHDNPYAQQAAIDRILRSDMTDAEKNARLYGIPLVLSGRIWKNYGEHNFIDPRILPDRFMRILSIDPHRDKPDYANIAAWDDYAKTLYIHGELKAGGDIRDRIAQIRRMCSGERIDLIVIDPSSKQGMESISENTILDFYMREFPGIQEADNSRMAKDHGRAVIDILAKRQPSGQSRLYVFRTCPVTHRQFLSYSYKGGLKSGEDRAKPQIIKREEDHCDCGIQIVQFVNYEIDEQSPLKQLNVRMY